MLTFCVWSVVVWLLLFSAYLADELRYRLFVNRRLRRSGFRIKPGSWSGFVDGVGLLGVVRCERRGRNYLVWVMTRRFFPAKVVLRLQRDPPKEGVEAAGRMANDAG
jgi:hypothetical protein